MTPSILFLLSLLLWLALLPLLILQRRRSGAAATVGLDLAYLISLFIIHWPGAVLYALPWYHPLYEPGLVQLGYEQSILGVLAFAGGSFVLRLLAGRALAPAAAPTSGFSLMDPRLPRLLLAIGLLSYFVIFPISGLVPSLTALAAMLSQLMPLALALGAWQGWQRGDMVRFRRWAAPIPLFPFMTLIAAGFVGFGIVYALIAAAFILSFYPVRRRHLLLALLATYLGLSAYVTYMRDRGDIRTVVWGGEDTSARVGVLSLSVSRFEWFNPYNQEHLARIDIRLNQNYLVGSAVYMLSHGFRYYAEGETLQQAAIAFVPRALWPDKPVFGGSGTLVSDYTGLEFQEATSVGVGQVMEFYINFGTPGVLVGFLLLGMLIALLDSRAAYHLRRHDSAAFLRWYLPGLGLLQPGGSLVEVVATCATGFITALLLSRLLAAWPVPRAPRLAKRPADAPSLPQ